MRIKVFILSVITVIFLFIIVSGQDINSDDKIIIDSKMSLSEAIGNQSIPDEIKEQLTMIDVRYYSFDGKLHQGQLVINKKVKDDLRGIFKIIEENKFPIAKVIPISKYNFSDDLSMQDNNTSSFNYRVIKGTSKLSNHALGLAIDINPFINPYIKKELIEPAGAKYDSTNSGTITTHSVVYSAFIKNGWEWGGDWDTVKDYQHFEKPK